MKIRKVLKTIVIVSFLTVSISSVCAGHGKEGGDVVTCSNSNVYSGTYFLDYLAAKMANPEAKYLKSTAAVIKVLKEKVPLIGIEFEAIAEAYNNKMRKGRYVWKAIKPKEIFDEDLTFDMPEGCSYKPTQLVGRRSPSEDRNYYFFDKDGVKEIKGQESWMFLHELLWNYYGSAFDIRMINEFIHNEESSKLSSEEFVNEIKIMAAFQPFMNSDEYLTLIEAEKFCDEYKKTNFKSIADLKGEETIVFKLRYYHRMMREAYHLELFRGVGAFRESVNQRIRSLYHFLDNIVWDYRL